MKTPTNKKTLITPSFYIHIPFCKHICAYCDFTKVLYHPSWADDYLTSLENEIKSYEIKGYPYSIYVGGGTPTSLKYDELERLLKIIAPYISKDIYQEYTFEANVETLDRDKLELLFRYGVNRLSLGVESTNDEILKKLNRHHTYDDVKRIYHLAREVGFNNINLDLMLALPFSNIIDTIYDVNNLIELNPEHISTYSLILEEHTEFNNLDYKEKDEDEVRKEYDIVHKLLTDKGYIHYEVSNFAKLGYQSKHNYIYWKNKEYYGFGLGASGYINTVRYTNNKNLITYNIDKKYIDNREYVDLKSDLIYQIMLNLRTDEGMIREEFINKFGFDPYIRYQEQVYRYKNLGLLDFDDKHIYLTYEGKMVLDRIVLDLIED